jgi:hypothetical protein
MTLSIFLIILLIIFLVPALLLPQNRIRFFLIASLTSTALLIFVFIFSLGFTTTEFEAGISSLFSFLFPSIVNNPELNQMEVNHLITWFMALVFYILIYLILFGISKSIFVGTNPNIKETTKRIHRILEALAFLVSTFVPLAIFFINIRGILPFQDGFLATIFNALYSVRA